MSRELQDQLVKTYLKIFGDLSFPTFPPSCSLECGDGWFRLVERRCHDREQCCRTAVGGEPVARFMATSTRRGADRSLETLRQRSLPVPRVR